MHVYTCLKGSGLCCLHCIVCQAVCVHTHYNSPSGWLGTLTRLLFIN